MAIGGNGFKIVIRGIEIFVLAWHFTGFVLNTNIKKCVVKNDILHNEICFPLAAILSKSKGDVFFIYFITTNHIVGCFKKNVHSWETKTTNLLDLKLWQQEVSVSTPCCQISTPYRLVVSEYKVPKFLVSQECTLFETPCTSQLFWVLFYYYDTYPCLECLDCIN